MPLVTFSFRFVLNETGAAIVETNMGATGVVLRGSTGATILLRAGGGLFLGRGGGAFPQPLVL